MSAPTNTTSQILQETIELQLTELTDIYPEARDWIDQYEAIHALANSSPSSTSVSQKVTQSLLSEKSAAEYIQQISHEEYFVVIEKLTEIMHTNATQVSPEELLYIEQQLSDLLGFSVTTELDGYRLQSNSGTIGAGQHLKRHPNDHLDQHSAVKEAGLSPYRSAYGWLSSQSPVDELTELREQFWVGVPVSASTNTFQDIQGTIQWFKYRKVLVINPSSQSFVVACIADRLVDTPSRQFLGSPELIRSLNCWNPGSFGKVLIFFVEDESNQIPLGPVPLAFSTMNGMQQ